MAGIKTFREMRENNQSDQGVVGALQLNSLCEDVLINDLLITTSVAFTGRDSIEGFNKLEFVGTNSHPSNTTAQIYIFITLYHLNTEGDFISFGTFPYTGGFIPKETTSVFPIDYRTVLGTSSGPSIAQASHYGWRIVCSYSGSQYNLNLFAQKSNVSIADSSVIISSGAVTVDNAPFDEYVTDTAIEVAAGDAVTGTISEYIDMNGYTHLNFQYDATITAGATASLSILGTIQDDSSVASDCSYIDVTSLWASVSAITTSGVFLDTTGLGGGFHYVQARIHVSACTTSGTTAYSLYTKKLYRG